MQPNAGFGHLDSLVDEIQKKQSDHVKVCTKGIISACVCFLKSVTPSTTSLDYAERKASTFGSLTYVHIILRPSAVSKLR